MKRRGFITMRGGTAVWLAIAVLLCGLLTWMAEARTWICWWDYPGPICTMVKRPSSATRVSGRASGIANCPAARAAFGASVESARVSGQLSGNHNAAFLPFILHHVGLTRASIYFAKSLLKLDGLPGQGPAMTAACGSM